MKDNFSSNSGNYAKYRPDYPQELFDYIGTLVKHKNCAWDCGTGNGQVAAKLAETFQNVMATDISANQLENAPRKPNISYSVQPAERTDFPDSFFDLIIVAQAIHWFDFEVFYKEVKRTAKPDAYLVATGYGLLNISPEIDAVILHFYDEIIGKYWDAERKYIDENYQTIPFPFEEIDVPAMENRLEWTFDHLIGYLETWSAVKHYIRENQQNPVELIRAALETAWGEEETRSVVFPLLLRIGKINS